MKRALIIILSLMFAIIVAIPFLVLGFALLGVMLIILPFAIWYIRWRFFREVIDQMDEMRERSRNATMTLVEDEDGNVKEAEVIMEPKKRR